VNHDNGMETPPTMMSALVLFSSPFPLQFAPLRDIVQKIDPAIAQVLNPATVDGDQLMVQVGPVPVMMASRAHPLTKEEVALATGPTSPWPGGREAVAGHQAHVLLTAEVTDDLKFNVQVGRILTVLAAALATRSAALAVLWHGSQTLNPVRPFVGDALDMQQGRIPDRSWLQILLAEVSGPNNTCRFIDFAEADQIAKQIASAREKGLSAPRDDAKSWALYGDDKGAGCLLWARSRV